MEVVSVAEGFTAEHVAKKSALFWNIDGLTLQLTDASGLNQDDTTCPISCTPVTKNPGMTSDGFA